MKKSKDETAGTELGSPRVFEPESHNPSQHLWSTSAHGASLPFPRVAARVG